MLGNLRALIACARRSVGVADFAAKTVGQTGKTAIRRPRNASGATSNWVPGDDRLEIRCVDGDLMFRTSCWPW
ncbi:hypothetical protein [Amycolatopsis echigonensis]|uniref:Uncharacterized protein n=1 Tax=Amycolatopsis echigonensis TaxID=2576905 RepID=A0A8E1W6L5_9PSEU|nr:hypothetical protein [Amycolatopsis echigonensis]MBB2504832.1 hypothetical protein [Amycolatopsis echigonensis]